MNAALNRIARLILIRHLEHVNDVILPHEITRGIEIGRLMRNLGILPDVFVSTPSPRGVGTIELVQKGLFGNSTRIISRAEAIGTLEHGAYAFSRAEIDEMLRFAADNRVSPYTVLAHMPGFKGEKMRARGREGAACLRILLRAHRSPTILAASHSGSRIEHVLAEFTGRSVESISLFANGEFAVLGFNGRLSGEFRCASLKRYSLTGSNQEQEE